MGEMKPIQRYFMQVAPAIGAPFGHYAESVPSEDGGWCLYADAAARIAELEEQNKNLLDLDIQSLNIERGKLDARFNGNAATKILAASFGDQFRSVEGAENFITMNLTDLSQPDPLPLEVTIRRVGGKSTTDVLGELRARIAALEAELSSIDARLSGRPAMTGTRAEKVERMCSENQRMTDRLAALAREQKGNTNDEA